jgi:glyoxylase-like metal-dependent hydrolase (beta-lactamase superfamily II)
MYETSSLLGKAPPDRAEKILQAYHMDPNELCVDYTTLLIDTGQGYALVDTGLGVADGETDPTYGHLIENLRGLGVAPDEIATVILTHFHPDPFPS